MSRMIYKKPLPVRPTPNTITDLTGRYRGYTTVVGYYELRPNRNGKKIATNKRHTWQCHCGKCNRYFTEYHKTVKQNLKIQSKPFLCPKCHGAFMVENNIKKKIT